MKIELQMIPTVQMEIALVPACELVNYISSVLAMHPSERIIQNLIYSLKKWGFALRTKKRGGIMLNEHNFENDVILKQITSDFRQGRELTQDETREYLKRVFINSYYTFNFVAPELGLTNQVMEMRKKFLAITSREPYSLISDDQQPIGLNLYHRAPDVDVHSYDYIVPEEIKLARLIKQDAGQTYHDGAFRKQINSLAFEAVRDSMSRKREGELSIQMNLLIAGFINPRMFGVTLDDYLEKAVPDVYQKQADINGDFEMPLPKYMS